jgi:hypothetical protein
MQTIPELCDIIRQTAYDIHLYHGHGHLDFLQINCHKRTQSSQR